MNCVSDFPKTVLFSLFVFSQCVDAYIWDPHSQSNFTDVQVTHAHLNLVADFKKTQLSGYAELTINNQTGSKLLSLDTNKLDIHSIQLIENTATISVEGALGEFHPVLGSRLDIAIGPNTQKVRIYYTTSPEAAGLQWLSAEQTGTKKMPFMYSQGEPINARSFMPIQDSPQLRFSYTAEINVPEGMMAVMSATNSQTLIENGKYFFEMKQNIPAYLVAIAIGDLAYKATGSGVRTGVYAEPHILEAAAEEFADVEAMVAIGEKLFGPYLWDQFDIVVMTPSFPIGGMENPRATFISATTISGDKSKSMVNVAAHELVHSWLGNLITNAVWKDIWLNEGFTVYGERRILEAYYGLEYATIHAKLGELEMLEEFSTMSAEDTYLVVNLDNRDPDDGLSLVPYEKGYNFLRHIENIIGRERFDVFLKSYISNNKFTSMTTNRFHELLKEVISEEEELKVDFQAWIYGAGFPASHTPIICPVLDEIKIQAEAQSELTTDFPDYMSTWTTQKWLYYIKHLKAPLDLLLKLEEKFGLSNKDAEIKTRWFLKLLDQNSTSCDEKIEQFLMRVGRGKFINPLYKKLKDRQRLEFARSIFEKARKGYHPRSVASINKLLNT